MIRIRKAKKGDGKAFCVFWNEGVRRKFFVYNGGNQAKKKKDVSSIDKIYASQDKRNFTLLAIEGRDKIVGSCSVYGKLRGRTRHRVELGWVVHPDYARQGIATKLVKRMLQELKKTGVKRIEAEAALENKGSTRLAKKLGFKIEGKRKKGLLLDDGRYVDTYLWGKILN
jgi:RimJ/RimL family protein N-acetyltransferase